MLSNLQTKVGVEVEAEMSIYSPSGWWVAETNIIVAIFKLKLDLKLKLS